MNISQSYKQEHGFLMHFVRLANTMLKDEERKVHETITFLLVTLPNIHQFFVAQGDVARFDRQTRLYIRKIFVVTAIYSGRGVVKKPHFLFAERHWKRNVVSRVSSAMYQLSLWQMGRKYVCWPTWSICPSCSVLSCGLLHLV